MRAHLWNLAIPVVLLGQNDISKKFFVTYNLRFQALDHDGGAQELPHRPVTNVAEVHE
jgi:hypothetical protein